MTYDTPILTVDVVLLSLIEGTLHVGLVRRQADPYAGVLALPGGYIHTQTDQDTTDTARRVVADKAGLSNVFLEQLATVSGPDRDPRGWSATIVYYALVRGIPEQSPILWHALNDLVPLAFDHAALIRATMERLRSRGGWTTLPAFFLPPRFTFSELRGIYEAVLGQKLNDAAFRRKIDELGVISPIAGEKSKSTARPAQLYQLSSPEISLFNRAL